MFMGGIERTFRDTFYSTKPPVSWYAAKVTILSPTRVKFTMYDMYDNVYGGIGDEVGEYETDVDASITKQHIARKSYELAVQRRQDELDKAEDKIIQKYKKQILKELNL